MKLLFIGDIFGKVGRKMVEKHLPNLITEHKADLVIANAENIAHGKGTRDRDVEFLRDLGVHVITGGNHTFDQKAFAEVLNSDDRVIRPANYPAGVPGKGHCLCKGVLCINLMGRIFMPEGTDSPFKLVDDILEQYKDEKLEGIFVDFHAETTSEKAALFHYLKGQVSAIVGSHTHIQTADEFISKEGTAFLSDAGMTGPHNSIIGMEVEGVLNKFLTGMPSAFHPATGPGVLSGVVIEIENMKAKNIERVLIREDQ